MFHSAHRALICQCVYTKISASCSALICQLCFHCESISLSLPRSWFPFFNEGGVTSEKKQQACGFDSNVFVVNTVVNTAPTQLIAVMARKTEHKHFPKREHIPLITSFRSPLGGLPLEMIQPLATQTEAWLAISGVLDWVMGITKWGYTLQFAQRPPRFSAVVPTSVQSKDAHVLCSEMMTLLAKGVIEMVPPAQSESGFCSRYFLVHKKYGGLRPSSISDTWIVPSWRGHSGWTCWSRFSRKFAQGTGSFLWTGKTHTFNSIQVYLHSTFYDTIVAMQLYRKLSFHNIFIIYII